MIYKPFCDFCEVLHSEKKGDYNIVIVSYGTHPCAYVSIPPTHPYYKEHYSNMPIECHGGLTFSESDNSTIRWVDEFSNEECSWIGWDYAHCNDFYGGFGKDSYLGYGTHEWTTQEILYECYNVIAQLNLLKLAKI